MEEDKWYLKGISMVFEKDMNGIKKVREKAAREYTSCSIIS